MFLRLSRLLAPIAVLAAAVLVLAACGNGEGATITQNTVVVSDIPWTAPERAEYRLMRGNDVAGSGVLSIEEDGDTLVLRQNFRAADGETTDDVQVVVNASDLRPLTVSREIDAPQGLCTCEAEYRGTVATVYQQTERDERTDALNVPARAYDSWADLFLWRTLDFREGFDAVYSDALTCTLARPEVIRVNLDVKGLETVEVPAGTFEAWRLEIRSGGETTKAWYADDDRRTLVRYDNNTYVFELESID
jgi:hypothetical protein